jgi:threonine/homoserine/homoserine lactone efflux protein
MFEVLPLIFGVLLMQATPGPNMMAVSSIALGSGRRAGVSTAAGVATGVFVWAVLFTFGMGAVLSAFPQSVTAMKLVGGGYLVYLGVRALRAAWRGSGGGTDAAGVAATRSRAYLTGLLVVLTNPKAALMWVAISMFLAASGLSSAQFLFVGLCTSASAMAVYGVYALLFSTGVAKRAYRRLFRGVEAVFGVVFGALGARLVSDGLRELRT